MAKRYLGDAVYVDFDGYYLVLTTEDGIQATNTIMLEPDVYGALLAYVEALAKPANLREEAIAKADPR